MLPNMLGLITLCNSNLPRDPPFCALLAWRDIRVCIVQSIEKACWYGAKPTFDTRVWCKSTQSRCGAKPRESISTWCKDRICLGWNFDGIALKGRWGIKKWDADGLRHPRGRVGTRMGKGVGMQVELCDGVCAIATERLHNLNKWSEVSWNRERVEEFG